MLADPTFQTRILRRQQSSDEYRVYRAALEWDLTDPIVIEKREDFKSEYRWRERLDPYHHQVTNLITFCRRLPVTLLADDVGLGKTISAGLVLSELIARHRVTKALVVCPKLLGPQWEEELTTKFDIPAQVATGRELISADPDDVGAVITTYASARLHLDSIPEDRFQMLILDEAHKLRNLYGVETPPQVAKKFRKALEKRRFAFVLMLTATPIHNRLWDLYSLVDLLTVARGHQNPFGSEGMFARKFIADNRENARKLREDARDEFRSIVYGYMSRVRRGDAKLYFPEREVQMHRVEPTSAELDLIRIIARPIQNLNRLAQISILQALVSSPHALMAQLDNMARNGTVPAQLAGGVREVVRTMPLSAKLQGLHSLVTELSKKNPDSWRLVVFTTRRETQTTIQTFLEEKGLKVGLISGSSGSRNQETIAMFRKQPPECHVVVSTEAGAEGVNLQVANVLVNYDLPWNPMIVEQRIGRIQRLASKHAKVAIVNIILRDTFEEFIVGRLMEKLQMASHAIGDIEALLEASGIDDDDESAAASFDEKIRQLVIASLAGTDVARETRLAEASIDNARKELEQEQATIQELLGAPSGKEYVGPRAPRLPAPSRSMPLHEFARRGFAVLGAEVTEQESGLMVEEDGGGESFHFEGEATPSGRSTLLGPGAPAFLRLVSRIVATGIHDVRDMDEDPTSTCREMANEWAASLGCLITGIEVREVRRRFRGKALVRARATVAHDSYERLVEVDCQPDLGGVESSRSFLARLPGTIDDPRAVGLSADNIVSAAEMDEATGEFCRFYLERREFEMKAAGDDERKRKKLQDDFTPRLEMSLVGMEGELYREVTLRANYKVDEAEYSSVLAARPLDRAVIDSPTLGQCAKTGRNVPQTCLEECLVSGKRVLKHLLVWSETSRRPALPEFTVVCALSGKRLLQDEVQQSDVTGRQIDKALMKTSAVSGKKGEPEHFVRCEFSGAEVLNTESATSEVSGKRHRQDQRRRSVVSGKVGHKDEFIVCSQTGHSLTQAEAERCEATGAYVRPGILEQCAVTGKRVLPTQLERCELTGKRVLQAELDRCESTGRRVIRSELVACEVSGKRVLPSALEVCAVTGKRVLPTELERCTVTGKRAIRSLFVTSSVGGLRLLEEAAVRAATGQFCAPSEVRECVWSGRKCHPSDLRVCELTGVTVLFQFAGSAQEGHALQPLLELLKGTRRNSDRRDLWPAVATNTAAAIGKGRCQVEAALLSPSGSHTAVSVEVRTMLGLRTHQAGLLFAIREGAVVGRVAEGRRKDGEWSRIRT